jgi:cell division protein FtsN
MKKTFFLLIVLIAGLGACKTAKDVVVKQESVSVINAESGDAMYKYYVIVGSFKERVNAENFISKLKQTGFNTPVMLKSEVGFFRVSVFSSDSEREARTKIGYIRSYYTEYNDVWLLIAK